MEDMARPEAPVKGWTMFDTTWMLGLFGTAVGAGILFLPINAGMGGFWPLVLMAIIVGPMTYFGHRGMCRFVLSSSKPGSDITDVVEEHFGETAGKLITLLYFFAIYPILLIYGVGITNTVASFAINQLGMSQWAGMLGGATSFAALQDPQIMARSILALVLIAAMMAVLLAGERIMLKVTEWLVYPLVVILFCLSLYLIPRWNGSMLGVVPNFSHFSFTLWITIPVLVFAFNHSPAISSFALSTQRHYGVEAAEARASKTLHRTAGMLLLFVMLFVFSCVLSLTPEDLAAAKQQNISILSYLANELGNPLISWFGPLIAFLAIASSFFGHYLGAREGLYGLVVKMSRGNGKVIDHKSLNRKVAIFFLVTLWIVATINPSILGMIESLGGPIIAMILFIMPMYAIRKVPAMQQYGGKLSNAFVVLMGCIAISAIVYSLV